MARDALAILLRVRENAVAAASRDLAAARSIERQSLATLATHRDSIRCEQAQACGEHIAAFATWLPQAYLRTDTLVDAVEAEQAKVARMQRVLIERQTEAEAVAKLIARQAVAAALVQARRDQAVMDEAAGRAGRFNPASAGH